MIARYIVGFALLMGTANAASRIVNLSSRASSDYAARAGTSGPAIVGFVIGGTTPKQVLLRLAGTSLEQFGITKPVSTPYLTLYNSNTGEMVYSARTFWDAGNVSDADLLTYATNYPTTFGPYLASPEDIYNAFVKVGAFLFDGWRPGQTFPYFLAYKSTTGSRQGDRAILITLNPGVYTMVAQEHDNTTSGAGTLLLEVYETTTDGRLVNISTRAALRSGEQVMIGGFVIDGDSTKRVLIRGIGPGIATQVSDYVPAPQLQLHRMKDGVDSVVAVVGSIKDLTAAEQVAIWDTGMRVGAFTANDSDSAMLVDLDPGVYSVVVTDKTGAQGVALVEIYDANTAL